MGHYLGFLHLYEQDQQSVTYCAASEPCENKTPVPLAGNGCFRSDDDQLDDETKLA